jgi:hypothetical protein
MCKENQLKLEKQLEDRAEQIVKLEMKWEKLPINNSFC